jgi:large subunit ribosomal protein L1
MTGVSASVHPCCWPDALLLSTLQESIDANKPPGAKGVYWKSMFVCTTMGPSVRVSVPALAAIKSKQDA